VVTPVLANNPSVTGVKGFAYSEMRSRPLSVARFWSGKVSDQGRFSVVVKRSRHIFGQSSILTLATMCHRANRYKVGVIKHTQSEGAIMST
jgi:hypothetical protein